MATFGPSRSGHPTRHIVGFGYRFAGSTKGKPLRKPTAPFVCLLILLTGCALRPPLVQTDAPFRPADNPPALVAIGEPTESAADNCDTEETRSQLRIASVAKRVSGAIVRVRSEMEIVPSTKKSPDHPRPTANRLGGTGIIIATDGVILTNEHVIRNAKHVTVTLADGSVHEVQRIERAEKLDLAVLYIGTRTETVLPPAKCFADPGIPVVAFSAARRDKPGGVRSGIITKRTVSLQRELDPSRTRWYDDLIESTAKLEPGYSGGPLLDMQGRLIGINTAAFGGPDDDYARAYAIPLHHANRKVISNLVRRLTRQDGTAIAFSSPRASASMKKFRGAFRGHSPNAGSGGTRTHNNGVRRMAANRKRPALMPSE